MLIQILTYSQEGSLNKFIIDDKGVMALLVFGLPPLIHTNDPVRALLVSHRIIGRFKDDNIPCKAGVATGRAWCGLIGNNHRVEYTVMGNTVNLAARLMGAAQPYTVLCDRVTKSSSSENLYLRKLKPLRLKGKSEITSIYRFTGYTIAKNTLLKGSLLLSWLAWKPRKQLLQVLLHSNPRKITNTFVRRASEVKSKIEIDKYISQEKKYEQDEKIEETTPKELVTRKPYFCSTCGISEIKNICQNKTCHLNRIRKTISSYQEFHNVILNTNDQYKNPKSIWSNNSSPNLNIPVVNLYGRDISERSSSSGSSVVCLADTNSKKKYSQEIKSIKGINESPESKIFDKTVTPRISSVINNFDILEPVKSLDSYIDLNLNPKKSSRTKSLKTLKDYNENNIPKKVKETFRYSSFSFNDETVNKLSKKKLSLKFENKISLETDNFSINKNNFLKSKFNMKESSTPKLQKATINKKPKSTNVWNIYYDNCDDIDSSDSITTDSDLFSNSNTVNAVRNKTNYNSTDSLKYKKNSYPCNTPQRKSEISLYKKDIDIKLFQNRKSQPAINSSTLIEHNILELNTNIRSLFSDLNKKKSLDARNLIDMRSSDHNKYSNKIRCEDDISQESTSHKKPNYDCLNYTQELLKKPKFKSESKPLSLQFCHRERTYHPNSKTETSNSSKNIFSRSYKNNSSKEKLMTSSSIFENFCKNMDNDENNWLIQPASNVGSENNNSSVFRSKSYKSGLFSNLKTLQGYNMETVRLPQKPRHAKVDTFTPRLLDFGGCLVMSGLPGVGNSELFDFANYILIDRGYSLFCCTDEEPYEIAGAAAPLIAWEEIMTKLLLKYREIVYSSKSGKAKFEKEIQNYIEDPWFTGFQNDIKDTSAVWKVVAIRRLVRKQWWSYIPVLRWLFSDLAIHPTITETVLKALGPSQCGYKAVLLAAELVHSISKLTPIWISISMMTGSSLSQGISQQSWQLVLRVAQLAQQRRNQLFARSIYLNGSQPSVSEKSRPTYSRASQVGSSTRDLFTKEHHSNNKKNSTHHNQEKKLSKKNTNNSTFSNKYEKSICQKTRQLNNFKDCSLDNKTNFDENISSLYEEFDTEALEKLSKRTSFKQIYNHNRDTQGCFVSDSLSDSEVYGDHNIRKESHNSSQRVNRKADNLNINNPYFAQSERGVDILENFNQKYHFSSSKQTPIKYSPSSVNKMRNTDQTKDIYDNVFQNTKYRAEKNESDSSNNIRCKVPKTYDLGLEFPYNISTDDICSDEKNHDIYECLDFEDSIYDDFTISPAEETGISRVIEVLGLNVDNFINSSFPESIDINETENNIDEKISKYKNKISSGIAEMETIYPLGISVNCSLVIESKDTFPGIVVGISKSCNSYIEVARLSRNESKKFMSRFIWYQPLKDFDTNSESPEVKAFIDTVSTGIKYNLNPLSNEKHQNNTKDKKAEFLKHNKKQVVSPNNCDSTNLKQQTLNEEASKPKERSSSKYILATSNNDVKSGRINAGNETGHTTKNLINTPRSVYFKEGSVIKQSDNPDSASIDHVDFNLEIDEINGLFKEGSKSSYSIRRAERSRQDKARNELKQKIQNLLRCRLKGVDSVSEPSEELPIWFTDYIYNLTGGHVNHMLKTIEQLTRDNALAQTEFGWILSPYFSEKDLRKCHIHRHLIAMATAAIDRLSPNVQACLKVASIHQNSFTADDIRAAWPGNAGSYSVVKKICQYLCSCGIFTENPASNNIYQFSCTIYREVADELTLAEQRATVIKKMMQCYLKWQ